MVSVIAQLSMHALDLTIGEGDGRCDGYEGRRWEEMEIREGQRGHDNDIALQISLFSHSFSTFLFTFVDMVCLLFTSLLSYRPSTFFFRWS